MKIIDIGQSFATWVYKKYAQDSAKALLHLGAVGWILSSLAQLFMITTNKDISKEKKKFLIPQEASDGLVNVGLYYTITSAIKYLADNFVEDAKIYTKNTHEIVSKIKANIVSIPSYIGGARDDLKKAGLVTEKEAKKAVSSFYAGLKKYLKTYKDPIPDESYFTKCLENSPFDFSKVKNRKFLLDLLEKGEKEFKGLKTGVGTIATIGASVLASSVITPIVRNKIANKFQDKSLRKEEKKQLQPTFTAYTQMPVSSVFSKF